MSRQLVLDTARSQLHVQEDAGPNKDSAGVIQSYWDSVIDPESKSYIGYKPGTDRENEWCAVFSSWVYKQAGYPLTHEFRGQSCVGFYGCGLMIRWLEQRGYWIDVNFVPLPGDLIFFDWQKLAATLPEDAPVHWKRAAGDADHVGIVESVREEEDGHLVISTIEGNWKGGVNRAVRTTKSGVILGYGSILPE